MVELSPLRNLAGIHGLLESNFRRLTNIRYTCTYDQRFKKNVP